MRNPYSKEELDFIIENYPILGAAETAKQCNNIFGKSRSYDTIRTKAHRLGLKVTKKRKSTVGRANAKKYIPIGTIIEDSHGYLHIKVCDDKTREGNYELYHRHIWEKVHGKVPDDKYLIFLDGNRKHCELSNLALIPKGHITLMMKYHLKSDDPAITKTSIRWCDALCSLPYDIRKKLQKEMRNSK